MEKRKDISEVKFTEFDAYLYGQGTHYESYKKLGAHLCSKDGTDGVYYAVWAPNAKMVSVISSSNDFNEEKGRMTKAEGKVGVWEFFAPGGKEGDIYRFVVDGADGIRRYKSDPYAFESEHRPKNASIVSNPDRYVWSDGEYMSELDGQNQLSKPLAIYEVHLGSWKKDYRLQEDGFINYRRLADELAEYVNYMGYTHVELMGICEYPFDGSWGYQCTGYFSPTKRHGTPDDFRYFVDKLHQCGIGIILDWVPVHFPKDSFSLERFDGTTLYEYEDGLRQEMPGWGTYAFDHGKNQVRSFLISSALYWVKEFHIDGIRVDAVAALFLNNFDRGAYRPNRFGGLENIEGMGFVRQFNDAIHENSHAFTIAEDSSIQSGVTDSTDNMGFGFDFKWNLGWMNDVLKYLKKDPIYRKYHHGKLTYTYDYAFTENFVLVLSHDEVVHLKHSMLEKMPGSIQDKFSGLKALYALQFLSPGKKLLFMGQDFAEDREWDEKREINWAFASDFGHRDVMQCVKNLLGLYRTYPCLYADSKDRSTFEWVKSDDSDRNIIAYIRRNPWNYDGALMIIANLSPSAYGDYSCGVPFEGAYERVFSTYDSLPGQGSPEELGGVPAMLAQEGLCDGRPYHISYGLRPNEVIALKLPKEPETKKKKSTRSAAKTGSKSTTRRKTAAKSTKSTKSTTSGRKRSTKTVKE